MPTWKQEPPSGRHVASVGNGDRLAADLRVRVQARGPWPDLLKDVEDAIDERRAVPRDELATDGITSDAAEEHSSPATNTLLRACSG